MNYDAVMTLEPAACRAPLPVAAAAQSVSRKGPEDAVASRLVGSSDVMQRVRDLVAQVASFDTSVLITGESGTGKELVARAIHDASERAGRPFVAINCGAIPAELLESELFGHERGAFTGAIAARKGRFELADSGTIFLDELGDMPLAMQVKLLRVIQERTFERVGGTQTLHCNVRIIAATHRDLEACIAEGSFREDLYYRVAVFPIDLPSLRERIEDLGELTQALCHRVAQASGRELQFEDATMDALAGYRWPGNVRELSNLVERMAVTCLSGSVRCDDLPARYRGDINKPQPRAVLPAAPTASAAPAASLPEDGVDLRDHLARIEVGLIEEALRRSAGVVAHAAQLLRVSRTTLVEKLRKYDIQPDGVSAPANG